MLLSSLVTVSIACAAAAIAFPALDSPSLALDVRSSSLVELRDDERPAPVPLGGNTYHNSFAEHWTGAVHHDFPKGTFLSVSGTIAVPPAGAITPPAGGDDGTTAYRGSAWVGIDGYGVSGCGVILQTGIDWSVKSGKVTYAAWYEWYPASNIHYSGGLGINAGDSLRFTVNATTATSGVATVENLTTGASVSKALNSTVPLCSADAEWIIEDFFSNGKQVPFANFGAVTFSNASAETNGGAMGPAGARLLDMRQNGTVLTHASYTDSTVTIDYIG